MIVQQAWGGVFRAEFIVNRYPYCTFGKLGNKYVAIISDYAINLGNNAIISVQEEVKRKLYKVDMDLRCGKGFHPTELSLNSYRFAAIPETKIYNNVYYIYRIIG